MPPSLDAPSYFYMFIDRPDALPLIDNPTRKYDWKKEKKERKVETFYEPIENERKKEI